MEKRISIPEIDPGAYQAMKALSDYTKKYPVDAKLSELIKIRASQINHCAYCIDMHTEIALGLGEMPRRIFALSAWEESHLFTEEEKLALQLTEEVTLLHQHGLTDATYNKVIDHFGEKTTAQILMQIVTINSWNRIVGCTRAIFKQ